MARKNTVQTSPTPNTLIIGLDIGYGVVKAVTQTNTIMFPSVAGHAREIKFGQAETAKKYAGDQILDVDGQWFIGDLALSQVPTGELLRLRGRTANDNINGNAFRVRLAKAALGKLMAGCVSKDAVHIKIATGLPVDHMRGADEFKKAFLGQHVIKTDECDFVANICDVMVMPQPYGTIYRQTLMSDGKLNKQHTAMRTGVCDVGTYTVDVALDDDGEFIDAESGSVESGVFTAQQRIDSALDKEFNQKMSFKSVEETLRTGYCMAFGEKYDFRNVVAEALDPLRSATLGLLYDKFKSGAGVDVLYLSGGGASLVFDDVLLAYPQTVRVHNPQVANAQGYLNYALFMENQS